jgi:AcrR family transcriptional regulator
MFVFVARKAGPNEESRERSRAQLLQAGAELLLDQAEQAPFSAVRLRSLCRQAGLSTGAFYVHWANLEEYYNELARHLTEEDELAFKADFEALSGIAERDTDQDALAAITRLAEEDLRLLTANPLWDAMELVALTWGRANFRAQLVSGYAAIDRTTGAIYGAALAKRGREPRPPLGWDDIGAILQALAEGLGLRHKIDPAAAPASAESTFDLYALAVSAVLAVLTQPAGDRGPAAGEAIRGLLNGRAADPA